MKIDFVDAQERLSRIGILQVASDFYMRPKRTGSTYFVKSPSSTDTTWSLALYPGSNRFCDFANSNRCGDIVGFISYIKGLNNWQALTELRNYYGLPGSRELDREEARRRIQLQRQQEEYRRKRQGAFETALLACVDDLKHDEQVYKAAVGKGGFEPFSDLWCNCVNKSNQVAYKLDILCAIGIRYLRLKPKVEKGCPSDRPQWLLDALELPGEYGLFEATSDECKEITAQRDFELTRQPWKDREFSIHWWSRGGNNIR